MKTRILSYILASTLLLSTFTACNLLDGNGGDDQNKIDHFLVSYEEVSNYTPAVIQSFFALAGNSYPEIESLIENIGINTNWIDFVQTS